MLRRHPWAIALMGSRTVPGPANLRHHDAVLGTLRAAGFSLPLAAHTYALLDAYVYGAALQAASLPFDGPDSLAEVAGPMVEMFSTGDYPHSCASLRCSTFCSPATILAMSSTSGWT